MQPLPERRDEIARADPLCRDVAFRAEVFGFLPVQSGRPFGDACGTIAALAFRANPVRLSVLMPDAVLGSVHGHHSFT